MFHGVAVYNVSIIVSPRTSVDLIENLIYANLTERSSLCIETMKYRDEQWKLGIGVRHILI